MNKKKLFVLTYVLFSGMTFLFVLEWTLIAFDNRGVDIWKRVLHLDTIQNEENEEFGRIVESAIFDSLLGWDQVGPGVLPNVKYIAQSFGDSFTRTTSGKSWQDQFLESTKLGILNFGIAGYGLDQAVLKSEKYLLKSSISRDVKYNILGIYGKMYLRSLSYYLPNYWINTEEFRFCFKPVFIKENGKFKLKLPPCKSAECLRNGFLNLDSDLYADLKQNDYWYKIELAKPELKFPRILSYIDAFPKIIEQNKKRLYLEPYFFINDHSIELTKYLITKFYKTSVKQNKVPIILLMYGKFELNGIIQNKREDNWLIEYLNENSVNYIDTAPIFIEQLESNYDINNFFEHDGHYNISGDSLVALSIIQSFETLGEITK